MSKPKSVQPEVIESFSSLPNPRKPQTPSQNIVESEKLSSTSFVRQEGNEDDGNAAVDAITPSSSVQADIQDQLQCKFIDKIKESSYCQILESYEVPLEFSIQAN